MVWRTNMKNLKNIVLCLFLCTFLIVPFSACKNTQIATAQCQLIGAETINTDISTSEEYTRANVLNQLPANHSYNEAQIKALKSGFVGYVFVGNLTKGTLGYISFSNRKYIANKNAKVYVGNNVYFEDKVFYVDQNGRIYVNLLILKIESESGSNVVIGDQTLNLQTQSKTKEAPFALSFENVINSINKTSTSSYAIELSNTDPVVLTIDKLSSNSNLYIIKNIYNQTVEYEFNTAEYDSSKFTYVSNLDVGAGLENNQTTTVSYTIATVKYLPINFEANITKSID